MFWTILFFLAGGACLYLGAEALVRGASRIAHALNVDPLLIGITVVGFGTSMPEMVISVVASMEKRPTIAVGNVIGSNIANIGLILGLAAAMVAVPAPRKLVKREIACMLAATAVFYVLGWRGRLDRVDGVLLLGGLAWFIASVVRWTLRESPVASEVRREAFREYRRRFDLARDLAMTVGGILALVLGGDLFVRAVVALAGTTGASELALSTTIVAVGGSLPELATSVVATRHRRSELLLGNLVGSNVFNILGALGAAALFRPLAVHVSPLSLEFLALLVFSVALPILMWRDEKVSRVEGSWLLAGYCIFVVLLFAI